MSQNLKKKLWALVLAGFIGFSWVPEAIGQDDLLKMLDEEQSKEPTYTLATFKASRLINGQTIETVSKNHLNFWISHRFGAVNSGFITNFFGFFPITGIISWLSTASLLSIVTDLAASFF